MMLGEICEQLENAKGLPAVALAAAVAQADRLAPRVIALAEKAAAGVCLLPKQANLLFFGLHALAAAREARACPAFLALLKRPELELERLLGDGYTELGIALLLGLYDGNFDALYAAIEDPVTDGFAKWSLFAVLARLAWEGRVARERLVELLDRFDRDAMARPGDGAWLGWQDAIMYLGLEAFRPRVERGWEAGRILGWNEADRQDWHARLAHVVAHPDDPRSFIGNQIEPVTDPVASLAWMERAPAAPEWKPDRSGGEELPPDPAEAIRLGEDELAWLDGFLGSGQAPRSTMPLDAVDGFFTALIAGPETVLPSEYMPRIWARDNAEGPAYDSMEQAQYVLALLMRHWNTISVRLANGYPSLPIISDTHPDDKGRAWASGFITGLALRGEAWTPLTTHEKARATVASIVMLVADDYKKGEVAPIAPEERAAILDMLPLAIAGIRAFWLGHEGRALKSSSGRTVKIGRNEPCPCGSGRKFKKCCGTGARA